MIDLTILALAVARLARLVASDSILDRPRNWVLRRWPASSTTFGDSEVEIPESFLDRPDAMPTYSTAGGAEVFWDGDAWYPLDPHWLGNLVACYWCNSFWIGLTVWIGYGLYPDATVLTLAPFALSYVAGWLNDRT